jgi:hypothetical protein
MPEDKPEPAAPAEAPRPASPSPAGTRNGEDLLVKYKPLAEDHPSYRKLKEALVRGQSAGVDEAVAELEAVRKVNESPALSPLNRRRRVYYYGYSSGEFFWQPPSTP